MTQTLTTDELRQIVEADHVQCGDAVAMARELLANREAQPVWIDAEVHEAIQDILQGRMSGAGRYVTLNRNQAPNGFKQRMPIYTAPPAPAAPAVPAETDLDSARTAVGFNRYIQAGYVDGWNACRAAMLSHSGEGTKKVPACAVTAEHQRIIQMLLGVCRAAAPRHALRSTLPPSDNSEQAAAGTLINEGTKS